MSTGKRKMVEATEIVKIYGSFKALDRVSFDIFDGEKVVDVEIPKATGEVYELADQIAGMADAVRTGNGREHLDLQPGRGQPRRQIAQMQFHPAKTRQVPVRNDRDTQLLAVHSVRQLSRLLPR